jgi:iron complex transport system substrate-binding protein
VSLIPSATEIVAALGFESSLVGRSHECDYPATVRSLPICTQPKFNPDGSSQVIHDRVTELLQTALSVYHVKTEVLEQIQPTLILTQAQCDVCAVNLADVESAVATLTQSHPRILSLQPNVLDDVWQDIRQVAAALDTSPDPLLEALQGRVEACRRTIPDRDRPSVACIEWIEPLMAAGNWVPELVAIAGGRSCFGTVGQHSPWMEWDALVDADPDIIIMMPCGFDMERTRQELHLLTERSQWSQLRAVQNQQVYVVDGNQYFNRPGPRLVDSLEILVELLQGDRGTFGYEGIGWSRVSSSVTREPSPSA